MRREWQPGDVAMVTNADGKTERMIRTDLPHGGWVMHNGRVGGFWADRPEHVVRPLVVLDPEDRQQVERLRIALKNHYSNGDDDFGVAAALREFANPTPLKPDEPLGLGAVVEDASGDRWVRVDLSDGEGEVHGEWCRNALELADDWRRWSQIDAVKVLSAGVES